MLCLFPHSIDKGIYLKNFIFLTKFRNAPKLLESLLPLQPLLGLCELLRRVEFQHFVFLLVDRCHHVKSMLHMDIHLEQSYLIKRVLSVHLQKKQFHSTRSGKLLLHMRNENNHDTRYNRGKGKGLEIPVDYRLTGNFKYLEKLASRLMERESTSDLNISDVKKCT